MVDIASKFLEHFLFIADALSFDSKTGDRISLWHKEDGFYYDAISWGGPWKEALPIKSLVGLIPLFAVFVLEADTLEKFPGFKRRFEWFLSERKGLSRRIIGSTGTSATSTQPQSKTSPENTSANGSGSYVDSTGRVVSGAANVLSSASQAIAAHDQDTEREIATANLRREHPRHRRLFALVDEDRLRKILTHMLSETEFLSEHGVRSYVSLINVDTGYPKNMLPHPKESRSATSSTDRNLKSSIGPPTRRVACLVEIVIGEVLSGSVRLHQQLIVAVNFLLIESLQRFWMYYRNDFQIECPTGSGNQMSLLGVAKELQHVFLSSM
jgi:hypothetical protein